MFHSKREKPCISINFEQQLLFLFVIRINLGIRHAAFMGCVIKWQKQNQVGFNHLSYHKMVSGKKPRKVSGISFCFRIKVESNLKMLDLTL